MASCVPHLADMSEDGGCGCSLWAAPNGFVSSSGFGHIVSPYEIPMTHFGSSATLVINLAQ